MSKAFTKEDNDQDEELENEDSGLPAGTKNYITPAGFERLKSEHKKLLDVERPEVVRVVSWAASNGDRSENGDYIYGKRRLREIDRRIRFLSKRMESAEVIDPSTQKGDKVLFGATVVVANEDGDEETYKIVGIDESVPSQKKVSWISPIAKSVLGARVGDTVIFRTPKGEEELEILEVRYENIE